MNKLPNRMSGLTIIFAGMLVELLGFALEPLISIANANLASSGGGFAFPNPGHMIFFGAGLVLVILGFVVYGVNRSISMSWGGVAVITVFATGLLFAVDQVFPTVQTDTHDHSHESSAHGSVTHTHGAEVPVTWEQMQEIDRMLSEARRATEKYVKVDVAVADGYHQEGPSRPGSGAHFINREILHAGEFDIERPTFLLYEHDVDWSFELVGIGWLLPKKLGDDTPPPYFYPLAAWHYHEYEPPGMCIWENGTTNALDESACNLQGGMYWPESPWMLHVWLYRPNPAGVFSLVNDTVDGIQYFDFTD